MRQSSITAFGISACVPAGWDARLFRHEGGEPTVHLASFGLPPSDGEFGTTATRGMPEGAIFLTITEYRTGPRLGALFAAPAPRTLDLAEFAGHTLLSPRPGQRGVQRFFSTAGRAFCLYAVLQARADARELVAAAAGVLATLEVRPGTHVA